MQKLRAVSIRQPFAEQVMTGRKKAEYRTMPTRLRERVYVYASLKPRPSEDWRGMKVGPEDVPLGKIIGTVEIVGCRQLRDGTYAWAFKSPQRLRKPVPPRAHPQPVIWFPFGK
jgi:hypothetical protein